VSGLGWELNVTLRCFFAVVAVGVFAAIGQEGAQATGPADELGCDRPIHLSFYEFGALYHLGIGIDADIVAELARRTGCKFETEVLPRADIWPKIESGDLDMTTSAIVAATPSRIAYFVPYMGLKRMIVARADIAPAIRRLDDVIRHADWRIGVVKGFKHGPDYDFPLRELMLSGRVKTYSGQDDLYAALMSDDVQVILSPAVNYFFYLPTKQNMRDFVLIDGSDTSPIPHSLAFSRKRFTPAMVNAWQRVIDRMRLDGTLTRIFGDRLPPEMAATLLRY
jgi:polar amino acid transport system substrate-binding protein